VLFSVHVEGVAVTYFYADSRERKGLFIYSELFHTVEITSCWGPCEVGMNLFGMSKKCPKY